MFPTSFIQPPTQGSSSGLRLPFGLIVLVDICSNIVDGETKQISTNTIRPNGSRKPDEEP
jgi:hypothetical protein